MDTSQHKTDSEELSARLKVSASDAMNQLRSMSVDSSQSMHISRPPASLVSISSSGVCRQITNVASTLLDCPQRYPAGTVSYFSLTDLSILSLLLNITHNCDRH